MSFVNFAFLYYAASISDNLVLNTKFICTSITKASCLGSNRAGIPTFRKDEKVSLMRYRQNKMQCFQNGIRYAIGTPRRFLRHIYRRMPEMAELLRLIRPNEVVYYYYALLN